MTPPTYRLIRNEIVMVCETPEAIACSELIELKDMNATVHSEWWGHPKISALPDGSMLVTLPSNVHNVCLLKECGALADRTDPKTMNRLAFFMLSKKTFTTELPLLPFQNDGGDWLVKGDLRRILSYDMGLGKTITAIAAMLSDPDRYLPAIIVAPAHVKLGWAREWEKWGGDPNEIAVLFGQTPSANEVFGKKLVVINHHILKGWNSTLVAFAPKTMIIDEAHDFVNSKSKTYTLANNLALSCGRRVLMLTATPLVNDLGDLWGLTSLISKDILGTKKAFMETFMPEEKLKAAMFAGRWRGGASNITWKHVNMARLPKKVMDKRIEELGSILRKFVILHVKKKDVLDQLPDITDTYLNLNVSTKTAEGKKFWETDGECGEAIDAAKEDVLASDQMGPAFAKGRINLTMAKMPDAIAWIEDFLAESDSTEKLVVAGWSVKPLELLHKHFKKTSLLINGSVTTKKKDALGQQFLTDPTKRLMFGNIKSIGTGIDQLVAARTMLFIELPLTAVAFNQIKGRIDRLSQEANSLAYYYMCIPDSYIEKMLWKIVRKKQILTAALGL